MPHPSDVDLTGEIAFNTLVETVCFKNLTFITPLVYMRSKISRVVGGLRHQAEMMLLSTMLKSID